MLKTAIWFSNTALSYQDRKLFFDDAFNNDNRFELIYFNDTSDLDFNPNAFDLVFVHESDIRNPRIKKSFYNSAKALVVIFTGGSNNMKIQGRTLEISFEALKKALPIIKEEAIQGRLPSLEMLSSKEETIISEKEQADHARLSPKDFMEIIEYLESLDIGKILFADDEIPKDELSKKRDKLLLANSIQTSKELITKNFDIRLAIIDVNFYDPKHNGYELCPLITGGKKIMLSGYDGYEQCLEGWLSGADFFISKHRFSLEYFKAVTQLVFIDEFPRFIGKSEVNENLWKQINLMAKLRMDFLISGEKGTGKELIAQAIFELGKKQWGYAEDGFISYNCNGVSAANLDELIFGSEDMEFSNATTPRTGLLKQADKGILFLDGILELPCFIQTKLYKAMQERSYLPVRGTAKIHLDTRIIFADAGELTEQPVPDNIYHDLHNKMTSAVIKVPPLRERQDDLEMLIAYFVFHFIKENKLQGETRFILTERQLDTLRDYSFPGNISELEMLVIQACINVMLKGNQELDFCLNLRSKVEIAHGVPALLDPIELVRLLEQGIITGTSLNRDIKLKLIDHLYRYNYSTSQIAELLGFTEQSLRNFMSRNRKER